MAGRRWREFLARRRTPLAALAILGILVVVQLVLIGVGTLGMAHREWGGSQDANRTVVEGTLQVAPGGKVLIDKAGDERCSFWHAQGNSTSAVCSGAPTRWEEDVVVYVLTPEQNLQWARETNQTGPPAAFLRTTSAWRLWHAEFWLDVPRGVDRLVVAFTLPNVTDPTQPYPRVVAPGATDADLYKFDLLNLCDLQPAYCFAAKQGDYVAYRPGFAPVLIAGEWVLWIATLGATFLSFAHAVARSDATMPPSPGNAPFTTPIERYLRGVRRILLAAILFWVLSVALVGLAAHQLLEFAQASGFGLRHLPWWSLLLAYVAAGPLLWADLGAVARELRRWARLMDSPPMDAER